MNSRKLLSLLMALCLTICFAGCSPKKTSTAPIMFVFSKMDYSDANATFSLFINEDGEYFAVAPEGTYTSMEFKQLYDGPSYNKSLVSTGMMITELSEYKVEGTLFTPEEMAELKALLEQIPEDAEWDFISMPQYDYADFPDTQMVVLYGRDEAAEGNSRHLFGLSNEEGGELRKAPDSFIGYCVDDEGSMKIVDKILGKMPLKDKELDYYGSYREYLDIG